LFRIANGDVLGYDQPIHLNLIEIPQMQNALNGVKMELGDCAFPLLRSITATSDLNEGFKDVDCAFFVGAKPRGKGQERSDLLKQNAAIFASQGQALANNASKNVKSLVVGNPANTNALILSHHAKGIPKESFCAMTRLDHDRALWQISEKTNTPVNDIEKLVIWGNHSPTMFPDLTWTTINGNQLLIQENQPRMFLILIGLKLHSLLMSNLEDNKSLMLEELQVLPLLPMLPSIT
jgi:malate dehydrogenase